MSKQPALTPKEVLKILKREGFIIRRTTGSHYILSHPNNQKRIVVPYHNKDLPTGTLNSIFKMAGLNFDQFNQE